MQAGTPTMARAYSLSRVPAFFTAGHGVAVESKNHQSGRSSAAGILEHLRTRRMMIPAMAFAQF
jgi:hypothetical protein